MSDLQQTKLRLNALLFARIESLAKHLYPEGHKECKSWRVGSMDINLRTGIWGDWDGSTDGMSNNLIDLWIFAKQVDFRTALDQIRSWLGADAQLPDVSRKVPPDAERRLVLPVLETPSRADLRQLSELRSIPIQGLAIAVQRRFLWAYDDPREKVRAWLITDQARKSAIARRLDGNPWQSPWAFGAKSKTLKGSWGAWPIGIREAANFPAIGITEGSPDFLALLAQSSQFFVDQHVAPVCMAGATMRIPESQLPLFSGKKVRIFIHGDQAGRKAAERWAAQLSEVTEVDGFECGDFTRDDGAPVGDLNDLCHLDPDCYDRNGNMIEALMDFAERSQHGRAS